ncbi:MAG TPA: hypothetical protein VHQ87_02360 [Rhizobacter sp.]|nr:hypothetical protein [Rhizobacter sp.]
MTSALLLPVLAAAQTATTQPARERSGNVETRDNVNNATRDGSRAGDARQQYDDAQSPGKSENSKGKKGEPPGQAKKSQDKSDYKNNDKNNDKNKNKNKDKDKK